MCKFIELKNNLGTEVTLCTMGASIYDIKTLDKNNELASILATPSKKVFPNATSYFGKTIGRTGGRITNGKFTLDGVLYTIPSNDPNGLHGGIESLSYKNFDVNVFEDENGYIVDFSYFSPHLESGYPGNAKFNVIYTLFKNSNKLLVEYKAISDQKTLINLSNHSYFNLSGNIKRDILEHELYLNSSNFVMLDNMLPKEIVNASEIYSFKVPHRIGNYLFKDEIMELANGYDFPYVFDEVGYDYKNITLSDKESGRSLAIYTTYPAVVVYTCNYPEDVIVSNNKKLKEYDAVCLECSFIPNSINSDFIDDKKDILEANKLYNEKILYVFNE